MFKFNWWNDSIGNMGETRGFFMLGMIGCVAIGVVIGAVITAVICRFGL